MHYRFFSWTLFLCLLANAVVAQVQLEETPISWSTEFRKAYPDLYLSTIELPRPDVERWQREDLQTEQSRFAGPIPVQFSLEQHGQWLNLADGSRLWLCKIRAEEAQGLTVFFENMVLPVGSRLWVRDPDSEQIHGAYSNRNQSTTGRFTCPFV
ncbi:MAG: hypothetical protein AAFU60_03125, partial [Bacteroidota bacterium]